MAPFSDHSKAKNLSKLKSSSKYLNKKRKDGAREIFS
jgi:hypothetical protein